MHFEALPPKNTMQKKLIIDIIYSNMSSIFLKKTIQTLLILVAIISFQNNHAFGQTAGLNQQNTIDVSVSPSNPRAGENITLEVSSYSINIDAAKITWYVDGVNKEEGVGQKNLTIKAKDNGQSTIVRVVAETTNGTIVETSKTIIPGGVDIIVEPTSYTPPFYKGKPIFVNQGTMRIVAVPDIFINGEKVSSKNLIFKWTKDDIVLPQDINTGNDSIIINGSVPIRDIDIDVAVSDFSGNTVAEASKIISAGSPKILFYEDSPLYGILLNKAIVGSYYLGGREEVDIMAKPYFFNIENKNNNVDYKWSMNGNPVSLSGKKNELVLKQTNTGLKGTAGISLDVNNLARIFQFASADFDVSFGQ